MTAPGTTTGTTATTTATSTATSARPGPPTGSGPVLARDRAELAAALAGVRAAGEPVAFVPTMGALHEGHASLARLAREHAGARGAVVASVFVNPLQFAPGEDLDRYPRTLEADLEVCAREGVDVVFAPSAEEMYPGWPQVREPQVTVEPGPLGSVLEGRTRPGHFRGVLTVVAKLLGLVRPDVAVFGEKDYQQLTLVRRMVADLCLGVDVVGAPTRRDDDGLALSSRNRFLEPDHRRAALALSRALRAAQGVAASTDPAQAAPAALAAARAEVDAEPGLDLDYLVLTDPDLADPPAQPEPGAPARVLVAARVGTTRLIDNLPLALGPTGPGHQTAGAS
ncbi:pantoate--beta-alanine ligase [Nocardioides sp. P86]|uniref:pantoate--beta-alanine ligase n=1 Tax=Nocardioides sp. P86 TaxID=2939569 RepID=UPI0020417704|nr:pantoate--beta-alanine ligase [Nocardioides sp. P86]MCM3514973.1 pantoate--beta-alanine ligase [Nocardioides sp. P86]